MQQNCRSDPIIAHHPHPSLLAAHLGGAEQADAWRRRRELQHRELIQAAIARGKRGEHVAPRAAERPITGAEILEALRRDPIAARRCLRELLAEDLAELHEGIRFIAGGSRNGAETPNR